MTEPEATTDGLEARLDNVLVGLASVHASIDAERDARLREAKIQDDANELRDKENVSRDKKSKRLLIFAVAGFVAAIIGGWQAFAARATADEIIAARAQSRIGLCNAIDDMRAKHNHFVNTSITERQALIDAVDAGTGTDEQKAQSKKFFEDQIANYRQDLLTVIDCSDPHAVDTLFTVS